jgi:hypothetical protein
MIDEEIKIKMMFVKCPTPSVAQEISRVFEDVPPCAGDPEYATNGCQDQFVFPPSGWVMSAKLHLVFSTRLKQIGACSGQM